MKKRVHYLAGLVTSFVYLIAAKSVFAQTSICPTGEFANLCNLKVDNGTLAVVGKIVTILLILGIILALFFLIWGGLRWIMSGGDKAKIEQARSTIIAAIVGLVIAFLAFFILNTVTYVVTGKTFTTLTLPTLVN